MITTIIFWVTLGIAICALAFGFLGGLWRGLKRSSLHVIFVLLTIILAICFTSVLTNAILNFNISGLTGGEYSTISDFITQTLLSQFSDYEALSEFILQLPFAVISPFAFMLLMVVIKFLMSLVYHIFARILCGKKKDDFASHKPHRLYGALIGMVESFIFVIFLFCPTFALTGTIEEVLFESASASSSTSTEVETLDTTTDENSSSFQIKNSDGTIKTTQEIGAELVTPELSEIVYAINHNVLGTICNMGGLGGVIYDNISTIEVNGTKIKFRKELENIADIYNESVTAYNNIVVLRSGDTISITSLKKSLNTLFDSGLFKSVLVQTASDLIKTYNVPETDLSYTDYVIVYYQGRIADPEFDFYTYIRQDLSTILDILEEVATTDVAQGSVDIDTSSVGAMVRLVDGLSDVYDSVIDKMCSLNILNDLFNVAMDNKDMLKDAIQSSIDQTFGEGSNVGINIDITVEDIKEMLKTVPTIVDKVLDIDEYIGLFDIVDSEDIETALRDNTLISSGITRALTKLGEILDLVSSYKIFNYTEDEDGATVDKNTTTDILATYDIVLLGDTVTTYTITDGTMTTTGTETLDTYTKLLNYIAPSVKALLDTDIINFVLDISSQESTEEESTELDAIVTFLSDAFENDADILAKAITPLYELDEVKVGSYEDEDGTAEIMTVKDLIDLYFEAYVGEMTLGYVSIENITFNEGDTDADMQENFEILYTNLAAVGDFINCLNTEYNGTTTYLDDFISGDVELTDLVTTMANNSELKPVLEVALSHEIMEGLSDFMFETIDSALLEQFSTSEQITNGYTSDYTNHYDEASTYASVIETILKVDFDNLTSDNILTELAPVLDEIKAAAIDGVLDDAYELIIWYLTSDVITSNSIYFEGENVIVPSNENYSKIQTYLHNKFKSLIAEENEISEDDVTDEMILAYYLSPNFSYTEIATNVQNMLNVATTIVNTISDAVESFVEITTDNVSEVVTAVGDAITTLLTDDNGEAYAIEDLVSVIEDIATVADEYLDDILSSDTYEDCKTTIEEYITGTTLEDTISECIDVTEEAMESIKSALLSLFGIEINSNN